jgi:hypothetical protein
LHADIILYLLHITESAGTRILGNCVDNTRIDEASVLGKEVTQMECEVICNEENSCVGYTYSAEGCFPHAAQCENFDYPASGAFFYLLSSRIVRELLSVCLSFPLGVFLQFKRLS